jgi:oxygen-dependent protoporphyrinogen oxidase
MNSDNPVIIIGAGLTGLSLAWFLKKAGIPFLLLEKEPVTGGVIGTQYHDGFTFETGPNTGVLSGPEIVELFEDMRGECTLEIAASESKKRLILKNGKWYPLPSGLISAITTPLFNFGDKLRILGEPFRKPGNNPDETLAELVLRRMGRSFLDYAVDPFISGIYAGDPRRLITRYALPKLYNLEQTYGSFIKGAIKKAREPKTDLEKKVSREVFSVEGGLVNLMKALEKKIGRENIRTNCRDLTVQPAKKGYSIQWRENERDQTFSAQEVISTLGANALPRLLPFIDAGLLAPVTRLEYARVILAVAGFRQWNGMGLDAFGGLVPSKENRNILGILFPSSMFKNRAPENGALLSVFLGGIKRPDVFELPDDEVIRLVKDEIRLSLQNREEPAFVQLFRYPHAIPQYDATSASRLEAIQKIQQQYPSLILAGNIRDGIGMSDRVKQAKMISRQLITLR